MRHENVLFQNSNQKRLLHEGIEIAIPLREIFVRKSGTLVNAQQCTCVHN